MSEDDAIDIRHAIDALKAAVLTLACTVLIAGPMAPMTRDAMGLVDWIYREITNAE